MIKKELGLCASWDVILAYRERERERMMEFPDSPHSDSLTRRHRVGDESLICFTMLEREAKKKREREREKKSTRKKWKWRN